MHGGPSASLFGVDHSLQGVQIIFLTDTIIVYLSLSVCVHVFFWVCQEDYTEPDEHEDLRIYVFQTFNIFEIHLIHPAVHVKQSGFLHCFHCA